MQSCFLIPHSSRAARKIQVCVACLEQRVQDLAPEIFRVRFGGSWTWYDRDADHLRRIGVELLKAYAAQF